MTAKEAKKLLRCAPLGDGPSRVNPVFTVIQALAIIEAAIETYSDEKVLGSLMETRVWQVCQNRKRPKR